MIDLDDISNFKEFFERMKEINKSVNIRFHGLEKNLVEGVVVRVANDFVEIRHRYSQFVCPYNGIRLVVIK
jgi:hypothetical protein